MNGEKIEDLQKQLQEISLQFGNYTDKCNAIKKFVEKVFDAARDTYPMDNTPLYKDFEDYFIHN